MFKAIVRFSIRKKLFVGLTTLFLFIGGIYAMLTLPIDAVPDITNNQVQIVTVSPTLAPQEVEQLITMPIEIAMSNIMNVEDIRSVSRFGLSVVTVVFKEDVPTCPPADQRADTNRIRRNLPRTGNTGNDADHHRTGRNLPIHIESSSGIRREI